MSIMVNSISLAPYCEAPKDTMVIGCKLSALQAERVAKRRPGKEAEEPIATESPALRPSFAKIKHIRAAISGFTEVLLASRWPIVVVIIEYSWPIKPVLFGSFSRLILIPLLSFSSLILSKAVIIISLALLILM